MTRPAAPTGGLMESEALPSEIKTEPTRLCGVYDPVQLQHNVNKSVLALREAVAVQLHPSGREPAA
ncbi:MAG: hypothetical protein LBF77_05840 [Spirochaetaceae bacterium]|jgi:hypothetical protein|nr:hypothetical protein [Spirochaetaceae bacterium]